MKFTRKKGSTSNIITVFIQDSSSTTGAGLAGLDESSSIVGGYVREGELGSALAVDENVTTEGTYEAPTTAGQVRIGTPANMRPGVYELHLDDSLFVAGTEILTIVLGGATNMADLPLEIQLIDELAIQSVGSRQVTINIKDGVAAPIPDVSVRIANSDGSITITSGVTDSLGNITFALDDDDYQVILRKAFVNFTVPELLTVAGDATHEYTGTVLSPASPAEPGTCVVYGVVVDNGNSVVEGAEIFINAVENDIFSNTQKVVKDSRTTSDNNGFWQIEVIRSSELIPITATYEAIITYPSFNYKTEIVVPDADSAEFSTTIP